MTGDEIRALREGLNVTPAWLARILAVHTSSVYRWEKAGNDRAKVDGLARSVLYLLADAHRTVGPEPIRGAVDLALARFGPLGAVAALLNVASDPTLRAEHAEKTRAH